MRLARAWQCLTQWRVDSRGVEALKQADVIVTQAAEFLKNGAPGPGNVLLAEHAMRLHERFGLPIIAQREVVAAKPDLPVVGVVGAAADGGVRLRPANTHEVCSEQKKICDAHGWKNVLVVTFPEHMWRACEAYKKLGLNPEPAVILGHSRIYYHKDARRWQLRSVFRFKYFWEIPSRLLFLKRGWI